MVRNEAIYERIRAKQQNGESIDEEEDRLELDVPKIGELRTRELLSRAYKVYYSHTELCRSEFFYLNRSSNPRATIMVFSGWANVDL